MIKLHRLILIVLILVQNFIGNSYAWPLDPSNFDECMVDGKVGRTNEEISIQFNYCIKKFPAIPSIPKNKDIKLACLDDRDKVLELSITGNELFVGTNRLTITSKTEESAIYKGYVTNIQDQSKATIKISINPLTGNIKLSLFSIPTENIITEKFFKCHELKI